MLTPSRVYLLFLPFEIYSHRKFKKFHCVHILLLHQGVIVWLKKKKLSNIQIIISRVKFFWGSRTKWVYSKIAEWQRIHLQFRRRGFSPWVGKIPGEGNGNPLQRSCLGNPMDRGAWWATVHAVTKESDLTTKQQQQWAAEGRKGEGGERDREK